MMVYRVEKKMPSPAEWLQLRKCTDWSLFSENTFFVAAEHSLFGVSVYDNNNIIGMGRVVGDGIICFYIQDVIVLPKYRNLGIGTLVITELLAYIKEHAMPNATIGLFAHHGTEKFYEHLGFLNRTLNSKGPGMYYPFSSTDGGIR